MLSSLIKRSWHFIYFYLLLWLLWLWLWLWLWLRFLSFFVYFTTPVIRCIPPLYSPASGSMSCTKRNIFGSVCKFSCQMGHNLRGSLERICETSNGSSSGFWTGSKTQCEGNQLIGTHLCIGLAPIVGAHNRRRGKSIMGKMCLRQFQLGVLYRHLQLWTYLFLYF